MHNPTLDLLHIIRPTELHVSPAQRFRFLKGTSRTKWSIPSYLVDFSTRLPLLLVDGVPTPPGKQR